MLEEMLFRGLLFWLVFELLRRCRVSKLAAVSATILVIAVGFAFSHAGRTGLSLYTTILTGIAFGWMRAQAESTAAAALMHAVIPCLFETTASRMILEMHDRIARRAHTLQPAE